MMHFRLLCWAMLMACAIGAITANAASAAKITYSGSGRFSVTSGSGKLETAGGTQLACKSDVGSGQLGKSPATTAALTVSFVGCEFLGKKCTSSGGTTGLLDTVKLLATFGEVKTKEVAGALLKPASGTAFLVAVKCGESELSVKGSIIGEFTTKLDTQTNLFTIAFALKAGEKGKQGITKFAGETKENTLESTVEGVTEVAGLESRESLLLLEGSGQLLA
jgi:hypothetical protein